MRALRAALLPAVLLAVAAVAGCAMTHPSASVPSSPVSADPSPSADPSASSDPSPSPDRTAGTAAALPAGAVASWHDVAEPSLDLDIAASGSITVTAGCLGFHGTMAVTGPSTGSTIGVRIARVPDQPGTARCMAETAAQSDFVAAVQGATGLTLAGNGMRLSGTAGGLELSR